MDLLKSQLMGLGIEIGQVLLPHLVSLVQQITPIITQVMAWMTANPQLTQTIVTLTAAGLALGPVLTMLGTAATALATGVGMILSPAGLLIAAIGGILAVAQSTYPGGIVKLFQDATRTAQQLATIGIMGLQRAAQAAMGILNGFIGVINSVIQKIQEALGKIAELAGAVSGGLGGYSDVGSNAAAIASSGAGPGQIFGAAINAIGAEFRAQGGPVSAGQPYVVGEQGPELFIPSGNGQIAPNGATAGGGVNIGTVTINANSYAEGRAAADGFQARLDELLRASG